MKYLHKFTSLAEFEAAYNDTGGDVEGIEMNNTRLPFAEYDTDTNTAMGRNSDDYYAETYGGRNPVVGQVGYFGVDYGTNPVEASVSKISEPKYIEPGVSLTIDTVNDVNRVDYNKQSATEEYDVEIDCNGQGDCVGQEILSMSTNVGPYQIIEDYGYTYTVTNPNLTTNPLPTLKVKVVNGPNNSDGVYECTYFDNDGSHGGEYSISEDPYMDIRVDAYNNDGEGQFGAYLTEGC